MLGIAVVEVSLELCGQLCPWSDIGNNTGGDLREGMPASRIEDASLSFLSSCILPFRDVQGYADLYGRPEIG